MGPVRPGYPIEIPISNTYDLAVVCYEDWVKMVMCNWNDYDGTVENDIINLYQEYLVKARKKK